MTDAARPSLIQRIASSQVQQVTGRTLAPGETVQRGVIQPFQPGLSEDFLKVVLDQEDSIPQRSRVGTVGYTHVSTLTGGVCPRAHVIAGLFDKVEFNSTTGGHRLMWSFGRAAENHIRGQLTKDSARHRYQIYGKWACACGQTSHVGAKPIDLVCGKCGHKANCYHEQPFRDEEYKIIGNPDMSLIIGRYFMPVEIKSMTNSATAAGKKQWESLSAPLAEHINQALMYRWLMARSGLLVHDQITFLYAAKEFKWGSPYKQFLVDATPPPMVAMVERTLELAALIKRGYETNTPPPRLEACATPDSKNAKACAQCATCWNLRST